MLRRSAGLFCRLENFVRVLIFSVLALPSMGLFAAGTEAASLERVSVSVLQFGTAHWELHHLKQAGLDRANGYELELRTVANLPASRLAVSSGTVDGAVADLLWVQARYEAGSPYLYVPFSSQIGDIVVAADSDIDSLADLAGRRIGVAGGPDSKGWILMQKAAEEQGLALRESVELQFAAPPLLNQALKRGQVDAIVTYWHFAARLKGQGGWRSALRMEDLLKDLGMNSDLPVLGYVFPKAWADDHPDLVRGFAQSIRQAKQDLAEHPEAWEGLQVLMRDPGKGEFDALREGFLAGTPEPLNDARIQDLHRLLQLTGSAPDSLMSSDLFYRGDR